MMDRDRMDGAIPVRLLRSLERSPTSVANDCVALVRTVPAYFTPEECGRILELAETQDRVDGGIGEVAAASTEIRRSTVTALYPESSTDWLFDKLEYALEKLNEGYGFALDGFFEGVQVAWYEPDGHYDWHVDLGPGRYSLRKLSMSVQLSDPADYEGGDLQFKSTEEPGHREQGSLIVFPSYMEHRVAPVTRGLRASMVSWISGPPFR